MVYGKTTRVFRSLYMDEAFKQRLKERAKRNRRSFNAEVIYMLESVFEQEEKQAVQSKMGTAT